MITLTNFIASIVTTFVTNTTEVVTSYDHYVPTGCPEGRIGCLVYHSQGVGPNAKTITTTAKKITTLTFDWMGERGVVAEEVLWSTNQFLKLDWHATDKPIYGSVFSPVYGGSLMGVFTNGVMTNLIFKAK